MSYIEKKYQELTSDYHMGEVLYLLGVLLFLFRGMWQSTMFPQSRLITIICVPFAALLIGLKILLYDSLPVKQFLGFVVILLCMMVSCYHSRSINPFFWSILLLGSRNIDVKKILQVYLVVVGSLMFLAFTASLLGVIENLQYEQESRRVRNSFGIVYSTDFAAHVFYFLTVCFYLVGKELRWFHYLITLAVAGAVYYYCDARLDSISIVLLVFLFWIGNNMENSGFQNYRGKLIWNNFWQYVGVYSIPLAAMISILATIFYRDDNKVWKKMNEFFTGRLVLGYNGIKEYGVTPWGQKIEMIGAGGSTEAVTKYNFVDCSYVNLMLVLGIVTFVLLCICYFRCCTVNRWDLSFLYCIAVIAVNCMIAHHLLQLEYNPFLLFMFRKCPIETKRIDKLLLIGQKGEQTC